MSNLGQGLWHARLRSQREDSIEVYGNKLGILEGGGESRLSGLRLSLGQTEVTAKTFLNIEGLTDLSLKSFFPGGEGLCGVERGVKCKINYKLSLLVVLIDLIRFIG